MMVSKAALKCSRMKVLSEPLLTDRRRLLTTHRGAVSALLRVRKPDWKGSYRLWLARKE